MNKPNIFEYATKELSQDALICWLVACAAADGGALQRCGQAFIGALMRHGREQDGRPCVVTDVSLPVKQYRGIDVYFQARVDGSLVTFLIEDKTDTSMHSGQLERYREAVRSDDRPEDEFRLVYYKTGYLYNHEREQAETAGYTVFGAEDMQRFLASQLVAGNHDILIHYRDHINHIVSTREKALASWDWTYDFVQYEFMSRLRDALTACGEQRADAVGDNADGRRELSTGKNRGGGPWTQYWFCAALFWRLDHSGQFRLRVWTKSVKQLFPDWTDNTWVEWMAVFQRLQREHGLAEASFRSRMYSGNQLVLEGTVGAVALPEGEADKAIPQIVRLHAAFLQAIGPHGDDPGPG